MKLKKIDKKRNFGNTKIKTNRGEKEIHWGSLQVAKNYFRVSIQYDNFFYKKDKQKYSHHYVNTFRGQ